jgi:hypothetical protein
VRIVYSLFENLLQCWNLLIESLTLGTRSLIENYELSRQLLDRLLFLFHGIRLGDVSRSETNSLFEGKKQLSEMGHGRNPPLCEITVASFHNERGVLNFQIVDTSLPNPDYKPIAT